MTVVPYVCTLITTTFQKKYLQNGKWRPNNQFLFRVISIVVKILKTAFPKEFFKEIRLKLADNYYISIVEIKFR